MAVPAMLFEAVLALLRPAAEYAQEFLAAQDARFAGVRLATLAVFAGVGLCLVAYRFLLPVRGALQTRPSRYVVLLTLPQLATLALVGQNRLLTLQSVGTGLLLAVVTYLSRALYEERANRYARLVAVLALGSAIYAAVEYARSGGVSEFERVDGLWGGAFKLSNIALIGFLVLLWRYLSDPRAGGGLLLVGIMANVFCMAVSGHRAGLLLAVALGGALLLAAAKLDRETGRGAGTRRLWVLVGFTLASGLVLVAQSGLMERYRALWQYGLEYYFRPDLLVADPGADRATASSMLWRAMILVNAISESRTSATTLLFGHGERSIVGFAGIGLFGEFEVEDPGSAYAWMLYNFGVLKIVVFAAVCYRVIRDGWGAWRWKAGSREARLAGLTLALIGLSLPVLSVAETVFHDNLIGLYFWSAIGVYYSVIDPPWMTHAALAETVGAGVAGPGP